MSKKYDFKLAPAYCLYNGVAVMEQKGSYIKFVTDRTLDEKVKNKLSKAFYNHVNYVTDQEDCPVEFKNKPEVKFQRGNRQELKKCISKIYEYSDFSDTENTTTLKSANENEEAAAVLLLDTILLDARNKKATDIHLENNSVLFRINGLLEHQAKVEKTKMKELILRIKYLAGMNLMETRRSQDGHFVYGKLKPVFIRVSSMGIVGSDYTEEKESIVIRILDSERTPLKLETLGFSQIQVEKIRGLCCEKNGLVLICGPTGSGKSTTGAAILVEVAAQANQTKKIISLEDPPEYIIPGVTQIEINEKIKNSFDEALIHIFRQDPDVLMIGEIRDEKSASAAIRAALTGHLVIATLHTSSAAGTILRLEDLGIKRNVIASVIKGVIIQDLYFENSDGHLWADVCLPKNEIQKILKNEISSSEIEDSFVHCRNLI